MTRTLLVTNDFPPKVGGIQSYLGELWGRLDPVTTAVLTASSDRRAAAHDAALAARGLEVTRVPRRTLYLPTPRAARAVDAAVARSRPDLVLYDPFVPLALLGRRRGVPYGVVLHGAEVAIPARLPVTSALARRVLQGAAVAVCAGGYPREEAARLVGAAMPPVVEVPPGVDLVRYTPPSDATRLAARRRFGLSPSDVCVVSVGRLVPRKGLDVLLQAGGSLSGRVAGLTVLIAGAGRDERRLRRLAARTLPGRARLLGQVDDETKVALLQAADLFAQPCRSRHGGLEQEGFGIVFLEAAACGLPQLAGRSGGSHEAVDDGVTGVVVDDPADAASVARSLEALLADRDRLLAMRSASRARVVEHFSYEVLARRLAEGLGEVVGGCATDPGSLPRPR